MKKIFKGFGVGFMALALIVVVGAQRADAILTVATTSVVSDGVLTLTGVDGSTWSVASAAAADDLTVSVTGATDSSLVLASSGTGADALQITTTAGGLDISVTGTAAGEDLDISAVGAATEMRLASASTENDAIRLNASAGGIDIDATTGTINITNLSTGDADDFTLAVTGATNSSLLLASAGTGADAISLSATAGGVVIATAGTAAASLDINATGTVAGNAITVDTTDGGIAIIAAGAANGDIALTAGDDFTVNGAATSLYNIGAATTSGTIIIGGTAQTGLISLGDTAASVVTEISIGGGDGVKTAINIGDGTGANGINIGTGDTGVKTIAVGTGAAANVITVGSENGAASLEFRYGTGALIVSPTPNTTVIVDEVAFLNFALAGGAATEAETATGLRTSAVVVCSPISVTNAVNWQEAVVTANTITFTFSADPGASTVGCMIHNI